MPFLDFRTIGRRSMTQKATAAIRAALFPSWWAWALATAAFLCGCTPHLAGSTEDAQANDPDLLALKSTLSAALALGVKGRRTTSDASAPPAGA